MKWNASKFHDEYRDVLMKLVERKIKAGQTEAIEDVDEDEAPGPPDDQLHGRAQAERRARVEGPHEERPRHESQANDPRRAVPARNAPAKSQSCHRLPQSSSHLDP